jgi:RHH-type proline utilization regulon transcriptional repressor/proline dehydrogenase/delta 1-pyrroline-5-carboxylate dehydrogenase
VSLPPFANEPVLELRRAAVRERLAGALASFDGRGPVRVPVWIGDERREGDALVSTDPGAPERVVALAPAGTADDAAAAVAAANDAGRSWRATGAEERAAVLVRAADELRRRRLELAALEVRECAKPWAEADADVCEAIDFLEYYARGAIALDRGPEILQAAGERNTMRYVARGVAAVISPWNFPIAIPTGMTAAALAVGNAAVLKPAEQSPGCALAIAEAFSAAGLPPGVLSLLPGLGEAGAALVADPRVHIVAFTGSLPVGLEIARSAAEPREGQYHLKRVIAELGGKNCVIVDADADLDDAVPALVQSAFGYAGQKCSAAARILVHEAIADTLIERLAGAVAGLEVGPADTLGTDVPPVIEQEAQDRVLRFGAEAAEGGTVVARSDGGVPEGGWYCPPTVVADVPDGARVLTEEVFGPLLTVSRVKDVTAACDVVDALPYGLTGGLFARNPKVVEEVVARTPVGNLYVNQRITGAMVGRQPFGGNRLSGTGTKAGGPDYLLGFVEPRVVTENTVRHGLVV